MEMPATIGLVQGLSFVPGYELGGWEEIWLVQARKIKMNDGSGRCKEKIEVASNLEDKDK
jgi:hypothetical protein